MDEYLARARRALSAFLAAVDDFEEACREEEPSARRSRKRIDELIEICSRMRQAAGRLQHSMDQLEQTGLDVVDLQLRLEGEGAALASALTSLDEALGEVPAFRVELLALEEAAERVAAGIFPNAIKGVREINRTLWDFRPIWAEYTRVLAAEVARTGSRRLSPRDVAAVEQTAEQIRQRFEAVNDLLNEFVISPPGDGARLRAVVREAQRSLTEAVRHARSRAADTFKPFHGVLRRAETLARKIGDRFGDLRVPLFPPPDRLEQFAPVVAPDVYAGLAGVERFALLNIGARLRSITLGDGEDDHLLAPRFQPRVFDVFPDRIYLCADIGFLRAVETLRDQGIFEEAPASLHRFNEGSYKQVQFRRGNLQLSYASGSPEQPDDPTKVCVDADIDLYRSPVKHLFGEVLVNHLTGSRTDQFRVWDTLLAAEVVPIGGFEVVSV